MDNVPLPAKLADDELTLELSRWYDPSRLEKSRRSPSRANNAIHDAFDLIGGVPRLAVWAHHNPGEFFTKVYPRTMQNQASLDLSGVIEIRTAIPRTALDGDYEDVTPPK